MHLKVVDLSQGLPRFACLSCPLGFDSRQLGFQTLELPLPQNKAHIEHWVRAFASSNSAAHAYRDMQHLNFKSAANGIVDLR